MRIELKYLKARKIGYLSMWRIEGMDKENNPIRFYIDHLANKPQPDLTYVEASDVKAEVKENVLYLLDERIIETKKEW